MSAGATALQDKDFLAAARTQQDAYLNHVDPDYASAAPEHKIAYLNHIAGKAAPTTADNSVEHGGAKEPGTWERLTSAFDPGLDKFSKEHPILGAGARFLSSAGAGAMAAPEAAYNMVRHPIDSNPMAALVRSLSDWGKPETWKGAPTVLPEALGSATGNVAAGEVIPHIAGGIKSMAGPATDAVRGAARKVLLDPVTGKPTVTPGPILERALRTPEEMNDIKYGQKGEDLMRRGEEQAKIDKEQARIPTQARAEALKAGATAPGPWKPGVKPVDPVDAAVKAGRANRVPTKMPEAQSVPLTESPYYNQNKALKDFQEGKPGPSNKLSESPNAHERIEAERAAKEKAALESGRLPDVLHVPEPRPLAPGEEKPGTMYSVPRQTLAPLAMSGKPGAFETLRDLGQPQIIIPRGTDYDFPQQNAGTQNTLPQISPLKTLRPMDQPPPAAAAAGIPTMEQPPTLKPMATQEPAPQPEPEVAEPTTISSAVNRSSGTTPEDALRRKMADINDRLSYTTDNTAMKNLIRQHRELERRLDQLKNAQQGRAKWQPAKETFPEHSPEVMEAAKQELKNAVGLWEDLPAPARYRLSEDEHGFPLPPRQQTWTGSSSPRPDVEAMFPWVKEMPGGLSELKRVQGSQKGLVYKRWLEAAAKHVEGNPETYLESHQKTREPGED